MVTDEEFLKLVDHLTKVSDDVFHLTKRSVMTQARLSVLTDVMGNCLAATQSISREDAEKTIQETVRKEYERLLLMIGDTSPRFAYEADLDPERPLE